MALLLFGVCSILFTISSVCYGQEFFTIRREFNSKQDLFQVPPSNCTLSGSECKAYHREAFASSSDCECKCPYGSCTFGFFSKSWTCIENTEIRYQSGCKLRFPSQQDTSPLKILKPNQKPTPYVIIGSNGCSIDYSKSKRLECNGVWSRLSLKAGDSPITVLMEKLRQSRKYKYLLNIQDRPSMTGRVISLYFNCPSLPPDCVLFKMDGETKCAFGRPTPLITSEAPTLLTTTQSSTNGTNVAATRQGRTKDEKGTSSGVIAAVIIVLLIIIIVVLLLGFIFWKRKRGERVWLLDQLSSLASKARRSSTSKRYRETENADKDEHIYAEIDEQQNITVVGGRTDSSNPSYGMYTLAMDTGSNDGGETEDGPTAQVRPSLTDEEGYVVPQHPMDQKEENPTHDRRNVYYNEPRAAVGRQSINEDDGYTCPKTTSPEYKTPGEPNRNNSSGYTYVEPGQVVSSQETDRESRTTEPSDVNQKRTRRKAPSPPRKI